MLTLPNEFTNVIVSFMPLFSQPVWTYVPVLLAGAMLAPGQRTVTAALGRSGVGVAVFDGAVSLGAVSPAARTPTPEADGSSAADAVAGQAMTAPAPDRGGSRQQFCGVGVASGSPEGRHDGDSVALGCGIV